MATIANIEAQREILINTGVDIGLQGNFNNHEHYNAIYNEYKNGLSAIEAATKIGQVFGDKEIASVAGGTQTYNDYYGSWYDKNFPH